MRFWRFILYMSVLPLGVQAADVVPAFEKNVFGPEVKVFDREGVGSGLFDGLKEGEPYVIVPIFTHCRGTCPIITQNVRLGYLDLEESDRPNVIVFSFDASETSESLKAFYEQMDLPATWKLVRSDARQIREFYDALSFKFMMSDDQFVHPNQFFVFNSDKKWVTSVVGIDAWPKDLKEALVQARKRPNFITAFFYDPERVAIFAFAGLLISISVALAVLLRRRKGIV